MDLLPALQTCSVLAEFPKEDLQRIAELARVRSYERGGEVFREGDPALHFYAIITGRVKLYKLSPEGKYHIVRLVSQGELFGEAAAFASENYPVSAETLARSQVLSIEAGPFLCVVTSQRRLAMKIIISLSRRLESVVGVLGQLALSDVTARLAKYLLDLSVAATPSVARAPIVRLGVRKSDLAARLGTASESLSRAFARLRDNRIIEVKGNEIRIVDTKALVRTAAGFRE